MPAALLTGLTHGELAQRLCGAGRATALLRWLHAAPPPEVLPARVPGVSPRAWADALPLLALPRWHVRERRRAPDGTVKLAIELDGAVVETVLIPGRRRSTICLSSQAGCSRRCAFCATATLGFGRNLAAGEVLLQWLVAAAEAPAGAPARNAVLMGMGEPFDNLDEVLRAVVLLTQAPLPRLRGARVTVSTSGVVPGMRRFLAESDGSLALSLNATTDEQRALLMPQTKQWPIAALLAALREAPPRRATFVEYVLLAGFNDSPEDARRLAALLAGLPVTVNLLAHNPFPGSPFRPPPQATVAAFHEAIVRAGLRCHTRRPRGLEVAAACGQLALA